MHLQKHLHLLNCSPLQRTLRALTLRRHHRMLKTCNGISAHTKNVEGLTKTQNTILFGRGVGASADDLGLLVFLCRTGRLPLAYLGTEKTRSNVPTATKKSMHSTNLLSFKLCLSKSIPSRFSDFDHMHRMAAKIHRHVYTSVHVYPTQTPADHKPQLICTGK